MRRRLALSVLIIALLLTIVCPVAIAQDGGLERVTVVILDQSGSMRRTDLDKERPRDPNGLRCSAVRLLADLATQQDILALVKLESRDDKTGPEADRSAEVLVLPTRMGFQEDRDAYKEQIDCTRASNNTPIADSLQQAYDLLDATLQERGDQAFAGQVLLLTDGEPKPEGPRQLAEIDALLPKFKARGWTINTIGLKLKEYNLQRAENLLRKLSQQTGGKYYGDVSEPLQLQTIFVRFFAEQTGRTFTRREDLSLSVTNEVPLQIPPNAERVDILVAKDTPGAALSLVRSNGVAVREGDVGVELFSVDDDYYAAFSIVSPSAERFFLRADRQTNIILNMLVTTDLTLVIRDTGGLRASNEPVVVEAYFARRTQGRDSPVIQPGAAITGKITFDLQSYPLAFKDDGATPDRIAGDGVYTAETRFTQQTADLLPMMAEVEATAQADGQVYPADLALQLAPVPELRLDDPDGVIRLPPGAPIELPFYLFWGGKRVGLEGWLVTARQKIGQDTLLAPTRVEGDRFLVSLTPLLEDEGTYEVTVDLAGVDQFAGLRRDAISFAPTVSFQPTLSLIYSGAERIPVGSTVVVSAALLQSQERPEPLAQPLDVVLRREGDPAFSIQDVQTTDTGVFKYTFTPQQPGTYTILVRPPAPLIEQVERTIRVEEQPQVAWTTPAARDGGLALERERWYILDLLRGLWLVGWPLDLIAPERRSSDFTLEANITRDGQSLAAPYSVAILSADGTNTLPPFEADEPRFLREFDLPSGDYVVEVRHNGLFPSGVDCCVNRIPLRLDVSYSLATDLSLAAAVIVVELGLVSLGLLVLRYTLAEKPRLGDKLVVVVGETVRSLDLYRSWKFNLFQPSAQDLSTKISALGGKAEGWPHRAYVTYGRSGVKLNGAPVGEKPRKLGDAQVSLVRRKSSQGSKRAGAWPGRRGLFSTIRSPQRSAKRGNRRER